MKRGIPNRGSFEARREVRTGLSWRSLLRSFAFIGLASFALTGCGTKAGEWLGLDSEKALFDLQSSDEGMASTTSSNPAARLGLVCVPRNINAGSAFTWDACESVQVQILDSRGARVVGAYTGGNDSALSITLSVVSGTGSLQIDEGASGFTAESGAISTNASTGLANFGSAGLNMTSAGVKILRASATTTAGRVISVSSPRFTVLPKDEVASLAYVTQPQTSYLSGIGWAKVPVVELRDEYGNRITTGTQAAASATFEIVDEPGVLRGTTTITASGGLIRPRVNAMNVLALGSSYVLRSSVNGESGAVSVDSNSFAVTHGPAAQVVFSQQPVGDSADDDLLTKPIVEIRDRFGNVVTTGADATAEVVLRAAARTGTLVGTNVVSGSITLTAVGGVADFSGQSLAMRQSGTNKRLEAIARVFGSNRARSSRSVSSNTFSVSAGEASPTLSTLTVSRNARAKADGLSFVTVMLTVKDAWGNLLSSYPGAGSIEFAASNDGNMWTQPSGVTDSRGRAIGQLRATTAGARSISVASPEGLGGVASVETSFISTVPPPTSLSYSQGNAVYTMSQTISDNIPSSSGGAVSSYSITPTLPSGLSFNTSNGRITGTPSATVNPAQSFTVTASNAAGSTAGVVSIRVNAAVPTISYSGSPFTLTRDTAYTLTATTTNAASVAIGGTLPSGLSLNSSTGAITGTPSVISVATPYSVSVTNSTGQTATTTINLRVNDIPPSSLAYSSPSASYTVGAAISNNSPSSSGGAVITYSITPSLASQTGLGFSTSTGVISGTPTTTKSPAGVYTVTSTNSGGSTTATVTFTVHAAAPTISYAGSPFTLTKSTGYTLTATSANVASVSLTGSLPTGMSFNSTTGAITGAPSALKSATAYTVTALNSTGQTATATFSLTVNDIAPSSLVYSSSSATYTVGSAIAPMTVSSVGGGAVTSYSAALPSGLSIHSTTGAISGTPSVGVASPGSVYTVTASNTGGSATASITITVLVPGCTNPLAINYASSATVDNGTCDLGPTDYPLVSSCSGLCQGMRIVRATQSHEIGGSNYDETWNNLDGICSIYGFRAPTTSSSNGTLWDYNINSSAPLTSDQWNPAGPWMNGSLPNGFIGGRIWIAAGAPDWLSKAIYPSVSAGNSLYSNSGSIQWESFHPMSGGNGQYITSGTIAVGDFVLCGDQNSSLACPASMVDSGGSCSSRMDCSQGGVSYWYNGSSYSDVNSCLCANGLGGDCTVSCSYSQFDDGGVCNNRMDCSYSGGNYWHNGNAYGDASSCGSAKCSSEGYSYSYDGSCYSDYTSYYCSSQGYGYSHNGSCYSSHADYCSALGLASDGTSCYCSGYEYNGSCYGDYSSYCSAQGYSWSYNNTCYNDYQSYYCASMGYPYSYGGSCYGDHSSYCSAQGMSSDGSSCYTPSSCSGWEYNGNCYTDHSSYCSAQGMSSDGMNCYTPASDCGDADDNGYDDCTSNYVCSGYDNNGDGCDCFGNCSYN